MAARTFTPWQYTADSGQVFAINVADYINSQVDGSANPKIGGAQADATDIPDKGKLRPRCALMQDPVSKTYRRVPVMDVDADLWVTANATLQLFVGNPPVLTTFNKYGTEGERSRHKRKLAAA